jgi:bacteriocin biosynthesis cyclodehydratase domain-containing protein
MSTSNLKTVQSVWFPSKEGLQIRTARRSIVLRGGAAREVVPLLLPLFDGSRSRAEVLDQVKGRLDVSRLGGVIDALVDKGVLAPAEDPGPGPAARGRPIGDLLSQYFLAETGKQFQSLNRLAGARVIVAMPEAGEPGLLGALGRVGLGHLRMVSLRGAQSPAGAAPALDSHLQEELRREAGQGLDVDLVAVPADDDTALEAALAGADLVTFVGTGPLFLRESSVRLHRLALGKRVPFLGLGFLDGGVAQIGPMVFPEVSACLTCVQAQVERAMDVVRAGPVAGALDQLAHQVVKPSPALRGCAMGLFTQEIVRALTEGQVPLSVGAVINLRLERLETETIAVMKLPRCPSCGPSRNAPRVRIWG